MSKVESFSRLQDLGNNPIYTTLADVVHQESSHVLGGPTNSESWDDVSCIRAAVDNLFERLGRGPEPTGCWPTKSGHPDETIVIPYIPKGDVRGPSENVRKGLVEATCTAKTPASDFLDCGWVRSERAEISDTLNKYFNKIDKSHWYEFGKDRVLEKDEILNFLLSDDAKSLSNQETADLVKAYRRFDEIKDSEENVWGLEKNGITRGGLWAFSSGSDLIYETILFNSRKHSAREEAKKELEPCKGEMIQYLD